MNEDPDLPNNLPIIDEAHFYLHDTVNKQNLRKWSAANPYKLHQCPFMIQKLLFGVLFGPGESMNPTSPRMNTDQPSQSHRNVTKR
jgi:hypothetical protein